MAVIPWGMRVTSDIGSVVIAVDLYNSLAERPINVTDWMEYDEDSAKGPVFDFSSLVTIVYNLGYTVIVHAVRPDVVYGADFTLVPEYDDYECSLQDRIQCTVDTFYSPLVAQMLARSILREFKRIERRINDTLPPLLDDDVPPGPERHSYYGWPNDRVLYHHLAELMGDCAWYHAPKRSDLMDCES
jgi:hypothetical protein